MFLVGTTAAAQERSASRIRVRSYAPELLSALEGVIGAIHSTMDAPDKKELDVAMQRLFFNVSKAEAVVSLVKTGPA